MKTGVEQQQYWLLQKTGVMTSTTLLHSTCNTKHLTIVVAKYLLFFVSCLTRHQQPNEGVGTGLAGGEHQCVWIF